MCPEITLKHLAVEMDIKLLFEKLIIPKLATFPYKGKMRRWVPQYLKIECRKRKSVKAKKNPFYTFVSHYHKMHYLQINAFNGFKSRAR